MIELTTQPFVLPPSMPEDDMPLSLTDRLPMRQFFESAYKPASQWKIGLEYETSGLHMDDMSVIQFYGDNDIEGLLAGFRKLHPEAPVIMEGDFCFGLKPYYGNITLEPGAQVEFSGAASNSLQEIHDWLFQFLKELCSIGKSLGVGFYTAGVDPFHPLDARPWSHKSRYKVMRQYLITKGKMAHHMMKQTMSAQFNIDYSSEADALLKFEAARRLQPLFLYLSSNSRIYEQKVLAAPMRGQIWEHTDPDRSGLPPALSSFDDYVEYALDVPMFLIERSGDYVPIANGLTFRQFLQQGFQGHTAVYRDWGQHLSTLFPEVRFKKNAIELRMFDGNQPALTMAFCALVKGIFFQAELMEQVNQRTWQANWADAAGLLQLAEQGLDSGEVKFLQPLVKRVKAQRLPGDDAVDVLEQSNGDIRQLFDHLKLCLGT